MALVTVAKVGDIAPGQIIAVAVEGQDVIVYRVGDRYYAAERWCLHRGADMRHGAVQDGFLVCKMHDWRFHPETGAYEDAPTSCLATYAVEVAGDEIQLDPTPRRLAPGAWDAGDDPEEDDL